MSTKQQLFLTKHTKSEQFNRGIRALLLLWVILAYMNYHGISLEILYKIK